MKVEYYGSEFEVPEVMIQKFQKDFEWLPGSKDRSSVYMLRDSVFEILDIVADDPELLDETEYREDFVKALAIRQAMSSLGILYDS
jgi:hypothetical protein